MTVNSDGHAFRVLGPVQATAVILARRQQSDLLALLLVHAGQVLTVDRIIDLMWGGATPRTAASQIKNMVSALRNALPDTASLDRDRAGYRLTVAEGALDLTTFTKLTAQARGTDDPAESAALLRQALALWHGDHALAGVRANFADAARAHLGEQRLTALEALFEAELECGRHSDIVAELTDAVTAHPARERLVAQLMTCLYRSGRTTDALSLYRRTRETLVEEYGLEPGQKLRDLERLILSGDSSLDSPAPTLVPAQLPMEPHGFAGRADELAKLSARTVGITAVLGTAGVGKTALALHWAHRVKAQFPDGQLYVDLRGFGDEGSSMAPADAIRCFLDAFAIDPSRIPDGLPAQTALYRSLIAGRKMLILLDNALSAEQVRPLLPGTPGCLVLVTSRNRLSGLVGTEGAYPLTLGLMSDADARHLLLARLGEERIRQDEAAVAQIVNLCARLPLALAMVSARASIHPDFPLSALSSELAQVLAGDGSAANVHSVFSWSYDQLSPVAASLFRLLSLHPGPEVSVAAAASLAGVPLAEARRLLTELAYTHLITERSPGWFSLHALLREYARELVHANDSEAQRRAVIMRLTGHYLHTANQAALLVYPHRHQISLVPVGSGVILEELTTHASALHWFTMAHPTLVSMVDVAAQAGFSMQTWQLAFTIAGYLDRQGHWHDWAQTQRVALAAAETHADLDGQAWTHSGLGLAYSRQRDYSNAHRHLHAALDLLAQLGDRLGQAYTHLRLTSVYDGWGKPREALDHASKALELYRLSCHDAGRAQALNTMGWYHAQLGQLQEAVDHCEQALELHRELGDRHGAAHTLDSLGYATYQLGDYPRAAAYYRESAHMLGETGDRYFEAIALTHLGDAHFAAVEPELARQAWKESLHILQELGHEDAVKLATKLSELDV
ncbi:AfsR/SARP family transcriptional regulator [Catelliglobosispora koreensis]|uniref:AfsR/SARP family transcriptional regulator n=1 Tax=Catelliglobosispora koreensis TaxID=129052 RepID=UPI0006879CAC|nr:BTAD domain-containing putative transcriptional regulator [Catelliglobosispora koreensis]